MLTWVLMLGLIMYFVVDIPWLQGDEQVVWLCYEYSNLLELRRMMDIALNWELM